MVTIGVFARFSFVEVSLIEVTTTAGLSVGLVLEHINRCIQHPRLDSGRDAGVEGANENALYAVRNP
jgi:hypothetical protein